MANRLHAAAKRGVSRRAANRRTQFAAALTIAAATAAGSVFGSEISRPAAEPNSSEPSRVRQALGGQVTADPAVLQTAGGLFDNLFGSSSTPAKSGKEDNRRAYALPPADPSTVNWNGIPYHTPKAGANALGASGTVEPIRDVDGQSHPPQRSAPQAAERSDGSSVMRSESQPSPRGLPQPPPLARGDEPRRPTSVPTALPAVPPRLTATRELSTESSSRRSGRRAIDPLALDQIPGLEAAEKVEVTPPTKIVEAVPRRAIEENPVRKETDEAPPATAPREMRNEGLSATAAESKNASEGVATVDDAWTATGESLAERRRLGTPATGISVKIDDSRPRLNDELAETSPISRTATAPEPAPTVQYPAGTIASQLSPLRPVHSSASEAEGIERADAAEQKPAAKSDLVGSGLAPSLPADSDVASSSKTDSDREKREGFAARQTVSNPPSVPKHSDAPPTPGNPTAGHGAMTAQAGRPERLAASEQPGIRVTTEGPAEIMIRELTQYEIRVENRGDFDATGVVVKTGLPAWAEIKGHNASTGAVVPGSGDADGRLEWTIDSLPAGVIERMFVRLKPARSGAFEVATHWTTAPQGHAAKVTVREPKLAVSIDGPDRVGVGEPGKYRVTVRNPGDAAASNVRFTLASEAGEPVDRQLGAIAAGKEQTFEIEITPGDPTPLTLRGSATADLDVSASAKKAVAVAGAELEATLAGPAAGFHKTQAGYQLKLVNVGRFKASGVECEVELPAGMTYVGGIDGATAEGNRVHWTVTELPAGKTKEFTFDCRLEGTGSQALSVRFNGKSGGRGEVRLETAVESIADLKLAVVDPPAPAPVGSEVIYEVIINNRGSKAAEDVRVVAQFGHGIEPIRAEGHPGEVVTGQVLFDRIPRIEPESQLKLRVVAVAETAGDHRFRAEVRCGESLLVAEEATVFVPRIDERISRSSSESSAR